MKVFAFTFYVCQASCMLGSTQIYETCICIELYDKYKHEKNGSWASCVGGEVLCNKPA